jgi:hypothetical protein
MGSMETTKTCPTCKVAKPITEYYLTAAGAPRAYCKPCHKARRKADYAKAGGKDVPYAVVLKREYGMTLEDYATLLRRQAHRCAVCRRAETVKYKDGQVRRLSVDHDHVTGKVRGLLCHRCNILVWAFEDNHTTLEHIKTYLDEFRATFH